MPTIAELITAHMDSTGASLGDLSRKSGDVLSVQNLSKIVTKPQRAFPKLQTARALSDALQVSITTIVLAYAASLGLPVKQSGSALEVMLPPGTDALTPEDRDAIRAITRALIDARREGRQPEPDLSHVEGLRLSEPDAQHEFADDGRRTDD